MKKIISLGGNYFQMTAVKAAKRLGYYVIDIDYLPDNPAHKFADEYYNISTLDKESVLKLAIEKNIDGIMAYASDVSAPTAAWVAEKLGLPTNPYDTVKLMTRKDLFHPFLKENGFNVPNNKTVKSEEEIYDFYYQNKKNIIIKPISASGSKGVTHIIDDKQIHNAYLEAMKYSREKSLVAEEFIQRKGFQIAGDAFIVDGKIAFWGLANEHFNDSCNSLVPVGESFPVRLSASEIMRAKTEVQKVISLLNLKIGAINLDFMFDVDGNIFIIELGPRNGGNLITDAIKMSTGIDLAEYTVKAALGEDISDLREKKWNKYISSYIWHTEKPGIFESIDISEELSRKIRLSDMFVERGQTIHKYINGAYGIGAALIQYDSEEQMIEMMQNMNKFYKIKMK